MESVERRLAKIEHEIELLKRQREMPDQNGNWIAEISGTFRNDSEFPEIVRLGKELRDAERPEWEE